jgi:hypothetical protein
VSARVESLASQSGEHELWIFHCPGCRSYHGFDNRWSFNGDVERPTFTPSLLINGHGEGKRCHSFVTDGRIRYLGDCDHELAGQTVELPPVDEVAP